MYVCPLTFKITSSDIIHLRQCFCQSFLFYLLNRNKTLSCLQFCEEENINISFIFGQKLMHKHLCMSWCVIVVHNQWLVFLQFGAFLTNCFPQSASNLNLIFFINRKKLREEFMIHDAIAIGENSEQNFHIRPSLNRLCLNWTCILFIVIVA